jgi:SPP1 gp7 family putative phage head morphogenesis protein
MTDSSTRSGGSIEQDAQKFREDLINRDEAVEGKLVASYTKSWNKIEKDLQPIYNRIDQAKKDGIDPSPSWLLEVGRLQSIQKQVEGELRRFGVDADGIVRSGISDMTAETNKVTGEFAETRLGSSRTGVTASFHQMNKASVEQLAAQLEGASALRPEDFGVPEDIWANIQTELFNGMVLGENSDKIAKRIENISGMHKNAAISMARTELFTAHRRVAGRVYKDNSDIVEAWQWHADISSRTCAACLAMHGTMHSLEEHMHTHGSCRCTMLPVIEGDDSTIPSGDELFKLFSRDDQRKVLGPTKLMMYEQGKIKLTDLVGWRANDRLGGIRYEKTLKELASGGIEPPTRKQVMKYDARKREEIIARQKRADARNKFDALSNDIDYSFAESYTPHFVREELQKAHSYVKNKETPGWQTGRDRTVFASTEAANRLMTDPDAVALIKKINPDLEGEPDTRIAQAMQTYISEEISTWVGTSGDSNHDAVRLQLAAQAEFNLPGVARPYSDSVISYEQSASQQAKFDFDRKVLRTQYDMTQETFREAGITHVTLARGVRWRTFDDYQPDWAKTWNKEQSPHFTDYSRIGTVEMSALSSYSSSEGAAKTFARGDSAWIVTTRIPVEMVHSTSRTGLGTFGEYEFVVLGSRGDQLITPRASYDQSPLDSDYSPISNTLKDGLVTTNVSDLPTRTKAPEPAKPSGPPPTLAQMTSAATSYNEYLKYTNPQESKTLTALHTRVSRKPYSPSDPDWQAYAAYVHDLDIIYGVSPSAKKKSSGTAQPPVQTTAATTTGTTPTAGVNVSEYQATLGDIKKTASPSEQKKLTTFENKVAKLHDLRKNHAITQAQFDAQFQDLVMTEGTKYMTPGIKSQVIKAYVDNLSKNSTVADTTIASNAQQPGLTPSNVHQGQAVPEGLAIKPATPAKLPGGTKPSVAPKQGDTIADIQLKQRILDAQVANGDISKSWYYKASKKLSDFTAQGNALPSPTTTPSYAVSEAKIAINSAPQSAHMDWDINNKSLDKVLMSATNSIDLIHGIDYDASGVGVVFNAQEPGIGGTHGTVYGSYKHNPDGWSTATIDLNSPYPEFTVVHEVGHNLYYIIDDTDSSAMAPVFNAINDTQAYKSLTAQNNATPLPGTTTNNMTQYLSMHDEVFSRAYAQYITLRSGSPMLNTQLQSQQASTLPTQWDNKDFEPVMRAFDEMFEELGWKNP